MARAAGTPKIKSGHYPLLIDDSGEAQSYGYRETAPADDDAEETLEPFMVSRTTSQIPSPPRTAGRQRLRVLAAGARLQRPEQRHVLARRAA
jgi:hypothetical protein